MIDLTVRLQTRSDCIGADLSIVFQDDGTKDPDIAVCLPHQDAAELNARMIGLIQEYTHGRGYI